jgi:hypothetical protein
MGGPIGLASGVVALSAFKGGTLRDGDGDRGTAQSAGLVLSIMYTWLWRI